MMAAIILLFMWMNQPSAEQQQRMQEEKEQLAREQAESDANSAAVLTVDSVSPAEMEQIRGTVKEYGVRDSIGGNVVYRLTTTDMAVTLNTSDNALGGTVKADGAEVPVTAIVSHDYGDIKPSVAKAAVGAFKQGLLNIARYQGFAHHITGDSTIVTLANDVITLDITNKGAQIASAKLLDKRYINRDSLPVELLSPDYGGYSFTLTTATQRFDTREFYFTVKEKTDTSVIMALTPGDGLMWAVRYTLPKGKGYTVRMDILQQGQILPANATSIDFDWHQRMPRNEQGRMFEERNSAIYYQFSGGGVKHLSENSDDDKAVEERLRWIGYKNQFFSAVIINVNNFTGAEFDSKVLKESPDYLKEMTTHATLDYDPRSANPAQFVFYLGPNLYPLLSDIQEEIVPDTNLELTRLIPLGWTLFRWINTLIVIPVFTFLSQFISNYGIIILLLTIFIKIILFPFTYKSYMSQARMRVLAPEIKAINEKYPGKEDAMKRQQETMALYSKAGANPMSGCLPMLLQMPILIAMFNFFPSAIELRGEPFLWAHDLSAPDAIVSWTTHIPIISTYFGNHISLFCLLMTVVNVIYTWFNMQNQPGGSSMPGMKWMSILMPIFFLVFFNNYAAGLSYYYFLSLLITIIQMWIFRKVVDEDKVRARMAERAKAQKGKKKSGFMARLEEAQRRQQQMLREQERKGKGRR